MTNPISIAMATATSITRSVVEICSDTVSGTWDVAADTPSVVSAEELPYELEPANVAIILYVSAFGGVHFCAK